MIIEKINNVILPPHYCEISYLNEIINHLKNKLDDNYVLFIIHEELYHLEKIINTENYNNKIKICIHVGNEGTYKSKFYDEFDFVFRYYLPNHCDYKKVFPINVGYNSSGLGTLDFNSAKKMSERNINCFFSGQVNNQNRMSLINKLNTFNNDKNLINVTGGFRQGFDVKEYTNILSDTKICLVPQGVSPETFRFTESFASGCIVITTEKLDVWYYESCPAVFLDSWELLTEDFINNLLDKNLEFEREKSLKFYNDYLSGKSNAEYIIKIISQNN
jgi:hypothetical protein